MLTVNSDITVSIIDFIASIQRLCVDMPHGMEVLRLPPIYIGPPLRLPGLGHSFMDYSILPNLPNGLRLACNGLLCTFTAGSNALILARFAGNGTILVHPFEGSSSLLCDRGRRSSQHNLKPSSDMRAVRLTLGMSTLGDNNSLVTSEDLGNYPALQVCFVCKW